MSFSRQLSPVKSTGQTSSSDLSSPPTSLTSPTLSWDRDSDESGQASAVQGSALEPDIGLVDLSTVKEESSPATSPSKKLPSVLSASKISSPPTPNAIITKPSNVHSEFKPVYIHTAKCDTCNQHNRSVLQRCLKCSRQVCQVCMYKDGTIIDGVGGMDQQVHYLPPDHPSWIPDTSAPARKYKGNTQAKKKNTTAKKRKRTLREQLGAPKLTAKRAKVKDAGLASELVTISVSRKKPKTKASPSTNEEFSEADTVTDDGDGLFIPDDSEDLDEDEIARPRTVKSSTTICGARGPVSKLVVVSSSPVSRSGRTGESESVQNDSKGKGKSKDDYEPDKSDTAPTSSLHNTRIEAPHETTYNPSSPSHYDQYLETSYSYPPYWTFGYPNHPAYWHHQPYGGNQINPLVQYRRDHRERPDSYPDGQSSAFYYAPSQIRTIHPDHSYEHEPYQTTVAARQPQRTWQGEKYISDQERLYDIHAQPAQRIHYGQPQARPMSRESDHAAYQYSDNLDSTPVSAGPEYHAKAPIIENGHHRHYPLGGDKNNQRVRSGLTSLNTVSDGRKMVAGLVLDGEFDEALQQLEAAKALKYLNIPQVTTNNTGSSATANHAIKVSEDGSTNEAFRRPRARSL